MCRRKIKGKHPVKGGCTHEKTGVRPRYTASWTTLLSPRLSYAYRSIHKRWYLAGGAPNPPQWRPSSSPFSFIWPFAPLDSSSFLLPTRGLLFDPPPLPRNFRSSNLTPFYTSILDTLSPHDTPLGRILPLEIRSLLLHARVPVDVNRPPPPFPPPRPTIPSCPARTTDRLRRPRRQRYNRLTHLFGWTRGETRAYVIRATKYNDLENFVVLGPGSLSRSFAGDDRSRPMSRTAHHEERCTRGNALRAIRTNRTTPSFESNSSGSSRRR